MKSAVQSVKDVAQPLRHDRDLQSVVRLAAGSRIALIGEASHGTSEFYRRRAELSRRLIEEHGFNFVAVEGDWPDCYEVNRFAKGYDGAHQGARDVLAAFERWPTWMWANWETLAFVDWLRRWNRDRDGHASNTQVGFYGLDVYSLWESLEMIIQYLEVHDSEHVDAARQAFACFEPFGEDPRRYAQVTSYLAGGCEQDVVALLGQLRRRATVYDNDPEAAFCAQQNAYVLVNAEQYYRRLAEGGSATWNLRDRHMAATLNRLLDYHGPTSKGIVWAHNTHVGDARATNMTLHGALNLGQLVREQHPNESTTVGFGTASGEVTAARQWGAKTEQLSVPDALPNSWEALLREASGGSDIILLTQAIGGEGEIRHPRPHRAIGVVYHPEHEAQENYVPTILHQRYDAFLFMNESGGLHPLHGLAGESPPQYYPWGF